ncbi:MAG TPA: MBL fold metallo-hydrolase [Gemmatimonadales bacterium]|nr:MBL fold metallo-hydrolase [Gemmatimonadales bacterium]
MLAALLLAARLTLPLDSTVLLIRVLDVSDARVGGDAILITDASAGRARHVLIDAGEHGATIVARLTSLNVDTLAAVILSHPHADHYGGLGAVVSRFPVRAFLYGGTPRTALTYRALLRAIDSLRIPVVTADTGVRRVTLVTGDDSVELRLLAPPPTCGALPGDAGGDAVNNCSVGVRLTRGGFVMLFPGDAEQAELGWWMMTQPSLLRADVLKAGHHGSSNATTAALLDAVQPRAVIISANGRQHPFASVLALLAARGIPTYCTADNGTVTVRVPPHGTWTVTTEREGKCHARVVRN